MSFINHIAVGDLHKKIIYGDLVVTVFVNISIIKLTMHGAIPTSTSSPFSTSPLPACHPPPGSMVPPSLCIVSGRVEGLGRDTSRSWAYMVNHGCRTRKDNLEASILVQS